MTDFTKYTWEEVFRYYDFEREDGFDGLGDGETLSSVAVTCQDADGADCSGDMISDAAIVSGTFKVKYKLKGGTAGETYTVIARVETSEGQTIGGSATIEVI